VKRINADLLTRYGTWRDVNVNCLSVKGSVKLGVKFSVMIHSTETTFAPKPEVALRVYCVAVRSAILATAWLLVFHFHLTQLTSTRYRVTVNRRCYK